MVAVYSFELSFTEINTAAAAGLAGWGEGSGGGGGVDVSAF